MTEENPSVQMNEKQPQSKGGGFGRCIRGSFLGIHYFSGLFVILMTFITVIHALGRYLFNRPVPGLVEMCTFMLVPIIFLAAPYTELKKGHTAIPLVLDRLPRKVRTASEILMYILYFFLMVFTTWQSLIRAKFIQKAGYVSSVLSIPHYPFIYVVVVGWLLLAVAVLFRLGEYIKSIKEW
ncbi:MAG: TRAP transporter small permease [Bacillota bacterium]